MPSLCHQAWQAVDLWWVSAFIWAFLGFSFQSTSYGDLVSAIFESLFKRGHLIAKLMLYAHSYCCEYRCATYYGTAVQQLRVWALCRPYCLTKVEARWRYSFGKTLQDVRRFGKMQMALRKENCNFDCVLQDKWSSAETATDMSAAMGKLLVRVLSVLWVRIRA